MTRASELWSLGPHVLGGLQQGLRMEASSLMLFQTQAGTQEWVTKSIPGVTTRIAFFWGGAMPTSGGSSRAKGQTYATAAAMPDP